MKSKRINEFHIKFFSVFTVSYVVSYNDFFMHIFFVKSQKNAEFIFEVFITNEFLESAFTFSRTKSFV